MEKFLADESVDFRIVTHLREDGYEIEAIVEINPSIDDEEVLNLANEMEAILLTEDKDFGELTYRLKKPNKGIILIRMSGIQIEEKIEKVSQVLENYLQDLRGKFTVISKDKVRIKDQE
ncbi:MAG: DUF5615 family PIN-like protein [Saprospirales bacterium]|nr:DUF5615 family PIN-like protein [Saprospirales bacterium]MBK8493205.1 DUF5615 family PIN-like protein [Saprospirales bacterium]